MAARVALVTGCSSGVGLAVALKLAAEPFGFHVYATMRDVNKADKLSEAIAAAKLEELITIKRLDVCDPSSVTQAIEEIVSERSRIDVLVNNAGFSVFGGLETMTLEAMRQQFDTNFFGAVAVMQAVCPVMRQQREGRIINVSSVGGVWGQPMNDVYCASKFALEGFTESMASVYRQFGVHVSLIEPGAIKSAFLANAQMPNFGQLDPEILNIVQHIGSVYRANAGTSNAQTPEEVADVIVQTVADPDPPLRVQTNPAIAGVFKAQLADPSGRQGVNIALGRFFPEGWNKAK
eukprot:c38961_g1_i1.p1 GENE.c38961_g1_i1~~c38961_g1_i1.p1  ORF type:complete len:315 (-),score=72.87 c38961_g1_i1:93-968(-)